MNRHLLRRLAGHCFLLCGLALAATGPARAGERPAFDCAKVAAHSMAELVCQDEALARLDRQLAQVYAQASRRAAGRGPALLKAEQRGWLKGRDDCWKAAEARACVESSYQRRTAELQATYRLVPSTGPVRYACGEAAGDELRATFFRTEPPVLIAERGGARALMYQAVSGSGARYVGRNESLWEHQGEALIRWGAQAPELRCIRRQAPPR